jgi:hypothetical protein
MEPGGTGACGVAWGWMRRRSSGAGPPDPELCSAQGEQELTDQVRRLLCEKANLLGQVPAPVRLGSFSPSRRLMATEPTVRVFDPSGLLHKLLPGQILQRHPERWRF